LINKLTLGIQQADFSLENNVNLELKNLNKTTLMKQTHETVKQEKRYTIILLEHLLEIEKRGLHLELGFSNLHNFLVVEFKYSDSEAATRVQAMRFLKTHPIAKEKMAEGAISLSQAADINRFLKAETLSVSASSTQTALPILPTLPILSAEKGDSAAAFSPTQGRTISIEEIIKEVEGKGIRESKELLEKMRSNPKAKTYSIEIDEEAWLLLQEIKKRESPSARDGDFAKKIFKEKLEKLNGKLSKIKSKVEAEPKEIKPSTDREKKTNDKTKTTPVKETPPSRSIGKNKRLVLFQEANYQCEYRSPSTGRRCECKSDLQVDHLYPYAWGGSNDKGNTRILCGQHNFFYAEQTLGKEKMASFRRKE
jgi:hypothetical protein